MRTAPERDPKRKILHPHAECEAPGEVMRRCAGSRSASAQLSFVQMDAPAERPYGHPELGSKYQGQTGPVASRYRDNRPR